MAGLGLDFLTQVINVHWGGGLHFLYSGADGMFGSKDGTDWKKAPSSVPATSLAWANDVWVGCNPDAGTWYSEDGAKTWISSEPPLEQVAAMKPTGVDDEGKPLPGRFAGYLIDDDGNGVVYTSTDGKSWSVALTIPAVVGESGSEIITGLSGCGSAFFVGTVNRPNGVSSNTANFYSSFDGYSFSRQIVATGTFWDGDIENVPAVFTGYGPGGVGFDEKTQMYLATIQKEEAPAFGVRNTYMQASQSGGGSFDKGTAVANGSLVSGSGDSVSVYSSVAGGDGAFVGGSALRRFGAEAGGEILLTGGEVRTHWLPSGSAQTLESYSGATSEEFIGSFCFNDPKGDTEETVIGEPVPGVFACVAYGAGNAGGVYIATAGGSFQMTHSGTGIVGVRGQPAGAVAVGKLGFSITSDEA